MYVCGGAKLLIFLYTIIILLYLLFLSSLWPRIELTQTQTWTQTVRLWEWEGGQREGSEYRRQDRTQSTHSLVNAGQRQKLLLMCSNVYVPIRMFVCMGKGGRLGKGEGGMVCFFLLVCVCVCGLFLFGLMQKRIKWP